MAKKSDLQTYKNDKSSCNNVEKYNNKQNTIAIIMLFMKFAHFFPSKYKIWSKDHFKILQKSHRRNVEVVLI